MAHVRQLMAELLVRTEMNEWAAHQELQQLENQLDVCSAAAWLAITERNRLRDRLAILSKYPLVEPCRRGRQSPSRRGCQLKKPEEECKQCGTVKQSSRQTVSDGSVVTISTEKQVKVEEGSTGSPGTSETRRELLLPMNIMTTIQKVLQDSLGIDVAFESDMPQ
ncbi:hypothetical protein OSTOST_15563 [Ostertagia ostertagi]